MVLQDMQYRGKRELMSQLSRDILVSLPAKVSGKWSVVNAGLEPATSPM